MVESNQFYGQSVKLSSTGIFPKNKGKQSDSVFSMV